MYDEEYFGGLITTYEVDVIRYKGHKDGKKDKEYESEITEG